MWFMGVRMDKYLVISADGHAGPPASVYRDYLAADLRQRFDERRPQRLGGPEHTCSLAGPFSKRTTGLEPATSSLGSSRSTN